MNMDYPSKSVLSWKLDGYSTNPDDDADVEAFDLVDRLRPVPPELPET